MAITFNPLDPHLLRDPYPLYHQLRTHAPVHRVPVHGWLVTRHADVAAVLRDKRFRMAQGSAPAADELAKAGPLERMLQRWLVRMDPPQHTSLRARVSHVFSPKALEPWQPRIRAMVDALLEPSLSSGRMDLVEQLADPLPVRVMAELLGLPPADWGDFKGWTEALALALDPLSGDGAWERGERAMDELLAYLERLIARQPLEPRAHLLSALLAPPGGQEPLPLDVLLATCTLLMFAGNETTANVLGNGLLALLRHPLLLEHLRGAPALLGAAVEELLRYDCPVQMVTRFAGAPVELGGTSLQPGDRVVLLLGAANRDPEAFTEPDVLNLERGDNPHLAFGAGGHFCLGAALARLQVRIALQAVLEQLTELTLESDDPRRRGTLVLRGLASLPVRFTRAL
jgi:cytochrome P450